MLADIASHNPELFTIWLLVGIAVGIVWLVKALR